MPFSRYENVSTGNPMPVQEVEGTYNAKEHISATNPLPVMAVEDGVYSNYESVSSANPQPIAIIADSGTYTRYEDYSDTNAFPVKFIEGQSYDPRLDVSETNPWPVVVISGGEEPPAEYEGPLDLVPGAVVAYGQRALSAAMLGQPLYTVFRDSDATGQIFSSDAETGTAPSEEIETFIGSPFTKSCGITELSDILTLVSDPSGVAKGQVISGTGIPEGAVVVNVESSPSIQISEAATATDEDAIITFTPNGYVTVWNDQSGNEINLTNQAASLTDSDPQWLGDQQGSHPALVGRRTPVSGASLHSDFELYTADNLSFSGGATIFILSKSRCRFYVSWNSSDYVDLTIKENAYMDMLVDASSNEAYADFVNTLPAEFTLWEACWGIGTHILKRNGEDLTLGSEFDTAELPETIQDFLTLTCSGDGDEARGVVEVIAYGGIMSGPNRLAIRQNIATAYGITLP